MPHPSRRALLRGLAAATAAPVRRASASVPVLRIAQWAHYVPAYDEWFDRSFARPWGERNGVTVEVEHISEVELRQRASADVASGQGHDLFGFIAPPPAYQAHAVPLTDVVTECERRFGKLLGLAHRGTYDPRTRQYFALAASWAAAPL